MGGSGLDYAEIINFADATAVLVGATAYILGFLMVASGLIRMRRIANMASMGPSHTGDGTAMTVAASILGGAFLVYLPTSLLWGGQTMLGSNALAYGETGTSASGYMPVIVLLRWVEVIGMISFVRSFWLMKDLGERGAHGQTVGPKIIGHMIAGLIAYNVVYVGTLFSSALPLNFFSVVTGGP